MTTTPLTKWKCDTCGDDVTADGGYVIWDGNSAPSGFRIIHQGRCDDKTLPYSGPLRDFLGADGLANITSMMSYGPIHRGKGTPVTPHADDYIDFLRRVQLPNYEEARVKLNDPDVRNDYADANEILPYMQESLERLADK